MCISIVCMKGRATVGRALERPGAGLVPDKYPILSFVGGRQAINELVPQSNRVRSLLVPSERSDQASNSSKLLEKMR
jgi:hypothetical protein